MSRSLGRPKKINSEDAEGRRMFAAGEPCPSNRDKGKAHAKWRGWQRAATEARTKGKAKS